jgi:hypothetical protein
VRRGQGVLSVDKANRGETLWLLCCWEDCERQGVQAHKTFSHDHARGLRCDSAMSKHSWFVFCSERHRQLFLNSHISKGNLPTGERGRIL